MEEDACEEKRDAEAIGELQEIRRALSSGRERHTECCSLDGILRPLAIGEHAREEAVVGKIEEGNHGLRQIGQQDVGNDGCLTAWEENIDEIV